MTAPVPALSTSADVEAVLAMRLRVLGVETPNPRYWSTNREFCEDVARDLVKTLAALSSPTTEGYAHVRRAPDGPCLLACPHNPPHFGDGAVGAGSAVEAAYREGADELRRVFLRLPNTPSPLGDYVQRRQNVLNEKADAIAQDADRTATRTPPLEQGSSSADRTGSAEEEFAVMQERVEFLRSGLEAVTAEKAQLIVDLRDARRALATRPARPCGSCGEPAPYVIILGGEPMPACLRHLNHWQTPAPDYTCPTACVEQNHPRREHHDWLAARTSGGGALREDEQDRLGREFWRVYDLWRQGEVITDEFVAEMIAATNRILAARATRPAPDDQAEGER